MLGQLLVIVTSFHPSYHEGIPRSVLEAMSIGRPIITTDAPGCRESIIHKHNGYVVKEQM